MNSPEKSRSGENAGAFADRILRAVAADGPDGVVDGSVRLSENQERARKRRNLWLALSIVAFMALVFLITVARLGPAVLDRPL